jgi:hypothetical protein
MFSIHHKVREAINVLGDGINELNAFILDFNITLEPLIANDLKGICSDEKQLSSKDKT